MYDTNLRRCSTAVAVVANDDNIEENAALVMCTILGAEGDS